MGVIFRNGIPYGGGGGSEPIEAEENQILVGNGDDWVKGGPFKTTAENGTINLEAQFDSQHEEGDSKNGVINIQGNFAKSGAKMPVSGSSWTQNIPCLTLSQDAIALFQNSYTKVVDSEICVAEGSEIHIDCDYNNTALPGTTMPNTAPKIRIHSNLITDLNPISGGRQVNPYVNIAGGLYFRSDSSVSTRGEYFTYPHEPGIDAWTQTERIVGTRYNEESSTFLNNLLSTKFGQYTFLKDGFPIKRSQIRVDHDGFEDNRKWQGPMFIFADSPFFTMEGIPTFAMKDLAYFEMDHAASVRFDNQATFEMNGGSDVKIYDNSCFHLLKNAWFYIDGNAGISMEGRGSQNAIFLTTYAEKQDGGYNNIRGRGATRISPMYGQLSFLSGQRDNYGNIEDAVFSHNLTVSDFDLDGTLYIEKGFSAHFGSDRKGGSTALKITQDGGHHVYLIEPSGSTVFKFAPSDTTTAIITPTAPVHFKYSNSVKAYYSLSPNDLVEITWQPAGPYRKLINADNYQERIEGNHYKDLWGNTRFIMRGEDGDDQEISQGIKQDKITFITEHGYSSGDTLADMENYTTDGVNDKITAENYLRNQYTGGNKRWGAKYDFNSLEILDIYSESTNLKYKTTIIFQAPLIKNANISFDQSRPIETASVSPTIQLYDSSNLVMRKSFNKEYYQEVAEDPIPVSAETLKQKLDWLKTTSYWTDFQTYLSDEGITYKNIYSISFETKDIYKLLETKPQTWTEKTFYYFDGKKYSSITLPSDQADTPTWYQPNRTYYEKVSVTGIFIEYVYEKTDHDEVSVIDAPVFEQTGKSELRMHDGAVLKVEVNDCDTSLTIGNGMDQSITFTFQELQALKALLSSP